MTEKGEIMGPKGMKLLRTVARRIVEEPKRLDMNQWAYKEGGKNGPHCGTVACIAGWTLLAGRTPSQLKRMGKTALERIITGKVSGTYNSVIRDRAAKRLGITREQARVLFHEDNWPEPYWQMHREAGSLEARAYIAGARIEHFIETGE